LSAILVVVGAALCVISGLPALAGSRAARATPVLLVAGALAGLTGSAIGLVTGPTVFGLPWRVPGGAFLIRVDALSAFFAAPVFLLAGAGALYAQRYWPTTRMRSAYVRAFFGLLTGALALVMTAGNTIFFLAAWEVVAGASFFLIATEHEQAQTRSAGWIFLAASHVATLALFAIVAILHGLTRTWAFAPLPAGAAALPAGSAVLWLALVAFGIKAGLMPFHVWLPGAHAAAPSHVSAVLSGVVIKMGIYGLVRVLSLFDAVPATFGATLLLAGIGSSVLGVAFALAQHDLKRLLAYHSIENIGIIVTGLGIGVLAQARGEPLLALLGYAGALLHVWNHSLFKSLLFFSAGAAIHSVHTREIDRMGGLAKRMPWTAAAFATGAVAIAGLPPLNGFVSEWLLYYAGFTSITSSAPGGPALLVLLVVPALALTGALALACFVKAFGAVFLGSPRTSAAENAREAPRSMLLAMVPLVLGCAAIGLLPATLAPILGPAVHGAAPGIEPAGKIVALLRPIQTAAAVLAAIAAAAALMLFASARRAVSAVTWDCAYGAPTSRMQYTGSSLARGFLGFFAWAMRPIVHAPRTWTLFPSAAKFETHVPDTALDWVLLPAMRAGQRLLRLARYLQRGRMQLYLLYLGATLVALLAWSAR
jgi:hydrogenase-4 component B